MRLRLPDAFQINKKGNTRLKIIIIKLVPLSDTQVKNIQKLNTF